MKKLDIIMDNFEFKTVAHGEDFFKAALALACASHSFVAGWREIDADTIAILWHIDKPKDGDHVMPYKMNAEQAASMLWGFVTAQKPSDVKPDIDGDVESGAFEIATRYGCSYEICRIKREWRLIGK